MDSLPCAGDTDGTQPIDSENWLQSVSSQQLLQKEGEASSLDSSVEPSVEPSAAAPPDVPAKEAVEVGYGGALCFEQVRSWIITQSLSSILIHLNWKQSESIFVFGNHPLS